MSHCQTYYKFVSTTAIIYSKLFGLTLRKFVMVTWSFDDAIWNMRSLLKTLGKLFLDFRFFINSIENCSICEFRCFELHALYQKWLMNLCRTFAWMYFFLVFLSLTMLDWTEAAVGRCSSKQVFLKTSQYSQENTCVRVSF